MRDRREAGAASVVAAAMLGEHGREGIDEEGSLRHRRAHCSWFMRGNWRGGGDLAHVRSTCVLSYHNFRRN
ncbi:hypothetical protein NL676_031248 [Syzygium grande]|nr:hypothetical protein NL676_031248 [Syzygium grande]